MTEAVAYGTLAGTAPLSLDISVATPPWLQGNEDLPCKQGDPELFFPPKYNLEYKKQIEEAKAVCDSCPIRYLCLDWAVAIPGLEGLWAGTTPPERRRMRTGKAA